MDAMKRSLVLHPSAGFTRETFDDSSSVFRIRKRLLDLWWKNVSTYHRLMTSDVQDIRAMLRVFRIKLISDCRSCRMSNLPYSMPMVGAMKKFKYECPLIIVAMRVAVKSKGIAALVKWLDSKRRVFQEQA
jgi:hypothetical protein